MSLTWDNALISTVNNWRQSVWIIGESCESETAEQSPTLTYLYELHEQVYPDIVL